MVHPKKQIRNTVFYEATILGLIGIPLGSLLGFIGSYMSIGCVCEIAVAIVLIGAIYLPVSKFLGLGRVKTIEEKEVKKGNIAFNTTLVITLFALLCVIILSMAL